ncbi:aconitase family protein, partial [Staphylococcus epidermidis]|uniref:aconitase family protein n=1 Tax=Staphylococcus epidermidis TaxID=1282 RepID=UPI00119CA861
STPTHLALPLTQQLRKKRVLPKFLQFFPPPLQHLPLPHTPTIPNIPPQYPATCPFFPLHRQSFKYMKLTPPHQEHIEFLKQY